MATGTDSHAFLFLANHLTPTRGGPRHVETSMKTKSLFLAATLMLTASAGASAAVGDTFEIDGLLYTVLTESDGNNTVSIQAHPYAFTLSGNLIIPETTTNNDVEYTVTTLPTNAFQYCTGLNSASIPASVKSIAYNSFYRCANISEFSVDENNETYCSVDGVIYSKDMKTLIICPNAKSGEFTIPDEVETIGENALNGCGELTGIIIPESVTTIGPNCFYLCTSLVTINIPAALTYTGDSTPLGRCSSLKEINVSEENEQMCAVDGVLYSKDMTSLIQWPPAKEGEIKIPESVTSIRNFSFSDCESLHTINISKDITTIGPGAFCYCPNLSEFTVDEDNENYCAVDGVLFNKGKTTLTTYPDARSGEYTVPASVKTISSNAFRGANVSAIVIPATVTAMSGQTFQDCKNLTKLVCLRPIPLTIVLATVQYTPESMVVYVPKGSKEAYEAKWPFLHNFEEIEGFMVVLSSDKESLTIGESVDLKANIVNVDAAEIKAENWSSSNSAVATVDQSGKVTAVSAGQATITVTATDENDQTSTDQCIVTVEPNSGIIEIVSDTATAIDFNKPLSVYDLSGKKIANSVANLATGIYIIKQNEKSAKVAVK